MKKILALVVVALVMCCCHNTQSPNTDGSEKTEQSSRSRKSNRELYPEKYKGAYIVERVLGYLKDVPEPKTVKSVGVIDESIAKVKVRYLDGEHDIVLKFDQGDWLLIEIDGVSPNQ